MSCGYALVPPEAKPRRSSRFTMLVIAAVLFVAAFIAAIISFRGRNESASISFFGKRAHFDFGGRTFTMKAPPPGSDSQLMAWAYSMRNPSRTPVCRVYGRFGTVDDGLHFAVMDSANFERKTAGADATTVYDKPIEPGMDFTVQIEGPEVNFFLVVYPTTPIDSAKGVIESLRSSCYEKW